MEKQQYARVGLVNEVLDHMRVFHSKFNTEGVFETCTYSIYVRGDLDDLYECFVEQIERRWGRERGLETRSDQVKAKYYVGHYFPGCILEVNQVQTVTTERRWEIYTPVGREVIYIER